jgi:hypothetical protein
MSTEQIVILFLGCIAWILWRIYLTVKSIHFIMLLTDQEREKAQTEESEERRRKIERFFVKRRWFR